MIIITVYTKLAQYLESVQTRPGMFTSLDQHTLPSVIDTQRQDRPGWLARKSLGLKYSGRTQKTFIIEWYWQSYDDAESVCCVPYSLHSLCDCQLKLIQVVLKSLRENQDHLTSGQQWEITGCIGKGSANLRWSVSLTLFFLPAEPLDRKLPSFLMDYCKLEFIFYMFRWKKRFRRYNLTVRFSKLDLSSLFFLGSWTYIIVVYQEVLIRMKNVGICGSDLHFLDTGRLGPKLATEPFVLGHEGAGVIEAVGDAVHHLEKGD